MQWDKHNTKLFRGTVAAKEDLVTLKESRCKYM